MSSKARREACRWLLRLQGEAVTAADRAAFSAWYRASKKNAREFDGVATTVDRVRKVPRWALQELEPRQPAISQSRRAMLAIGGAGALAASLVAVAWFVETMPRAGESLTFETALGVQRPVKLADGSLVELNTNTRVAVRINAVRRQVRLMHGEALFTVARDPKRPFEVEAGGRIMRAVGTVFSVRVDTNAPQLLVIEGAVSVTPTGSGQPQLVSAGQSFDLTGHATATALSGDDIERVLAWRRGMIDVDGVRLGEVVHEIERYTGAQFIFADPAIEDLPMVAYFRAAELDSFISSLESSYLLLNVRATSKGYLIEQRPEDGR